MEKRAILKQLIMKESENPNDFLDRCKVQLYALKEHLPEEQRLTDAWQASFEDEVLLAFIAGLKENIRVKIEEDGNLDSLSAVLKAANSIYNAHDSTKPPTTAALATIHEEDVG